MDTKDKRNKRGKAVALATSAALVVSMGVPAAAVAEEVDKAAAPQAAYQRDNAVDEMLAQDTAGSMQDADACSNTEAPAADKAIMFDGVAYATLAEAFDAAKGGGTITLTDDVTVAGQTDADAVGLTGDVVLDLAGHTVFGQNDNIAIRVKDAQGGSLSVKNGAIEALQGTFCTVSAGKASLTLENVSLKNSTEFGMSVKAFSGGHIVLKNCQSASNAGGGAVAAGGIVDLYDCSFTQMGYYDWNSTLLAASNGTGVVNVYGGTYTGENYGAYIFTSGGVVNFHSGTLEVSGDKPAFKADLDKGSYPNATGSVNIEDGAFKGSFKLAEGVDAAITGGSFDAEPPAQYVGDGFAMLVDENGLAVVMPEADAKAKAAAVVEKGGKQVYYTSRKAAEEANPNPEKPIVFYCVQVGDQKFGTLSEAIEAAAAKDVVLLLDNVSDNVVIAEGKDIVLDLNGKTLSGGTTPNRAALTNNGTIVIKDSSGDNSGRIIREDVVAPSYYTIDNQGTMTIESGTVYNNAGDMKSGSSLIRNAGAGKQATLNIAGGKLQQDKFIVVKNDDLGILNVTGGTIVTSSGEGNALPSAIQNWGQATLSGGVIDGAIWTGTWSDDLPESQTVIKGDVVVNGEIVVRKEKTCSNAVPSLGIEGGMLNVTKWNIADDSSKVEISDGTFGKGTALPDEKWIVPGFSLVQNPDGSYGVEEDRPVAPVYDVTVSETTGGSVSASPSKAEEGDEVVIVVKPDAGKKPGSISVTDVAGGAVEVTQKADGTYAFAMPKGGALVSVSFVCDGGELCPSHAFSDFDANAWYHASIDWAVESGVLRGIGGTDLLAPEDETTRAQVVTLLARIAGEDPIAVRAAGFSDVPDDMWCADEIVWGVANGIVEGYVGTGMFGPDDSVTREQLAVFLFRFAQTQGLDTSARADLTAFPDAGEVSAWASDAMSWAVAEGYVRGVSDAELQPGGAADRAQVVAMLQRFCDASGIKVALL